MKERFFKWFYGESDPMEHILDCAEVPDESREEWKYEEHEIEREISRRVHTQSVIRAERRGFYAFYLIIAVISCLMLIGVLLFTVSQLPRYGVENPRAKEVIERYVEKGLEETGAVNIVSGMILDYRAFDTLGESHVLFTALLCVMILLRLDEKNKRTRYENYYTVLADPYYDISTDPIMRIAATITLPSIFLFGIYILLNGQISPGGGFSGGAVMGAALIIYAAAFGFTVTDRVFTYRMSRCITFLSLAFYIFAKGYVFFTGANGIPNGVPKGTPGAVLSGGLILPLDIAVGMVVACTMFGFYSLFRRGSIGGE